MHLASIGIDLGKTTFHLVALGERNKILLRWKFSRSPLLAYTANLPASLIGLEARAGAHFMGAALREQGHQVRLIPAQFVKPYRKPNKNDFIDAGAIAPRNKVVVAIADKLALRSRPETWLAELWVGSAVSVARSGTGLANFVCTFPPTPYDEPCFVQATTRCCFGWSRC